MIPGIDDRLMVAGITALLTFGVTRLVDYVRAKDEASQLARGIALPLLALARTIDSNARLFTQALVADDERLRGLYKFVPELVPATDLEEYSSRVKAASKLRHGLLDCLRRAQTDMSQARGRYDDVRQLVEVSSGVRGESEGVGRLLDRARAATHAALRDLRTVSPSDTRRQIDQFLREHP